MKDYLAYIRVSTTRQGIQGVSLQEQREAIERYAQRGQMKICRWFEEQETASKEGRPVFGEIMKLLRSRAAAGVIIHKVDRSSRNLVDWAPFDHLVDEGIEVHVAGEGLDLTSRGGRLTANIQAVIAADYSRNLRDEAKKGFYGRLKQGYFPMRAPLGYLDNGAAKPKTLDPATAPLIRQAFELYATGKYRLASLAKELQSAGLRRRRSGKPLHPNRLSELLNNPFYYGLIHIQKGDQYFQGIHQPLISKRLFDQVQAVLKGKTNTRFQKHDFLYRRRLACKSCQYSLVGETHKGFIYYRCQTSECPTTSVREEAVSSAVLEQLFPLQLTPLERAYLQQETQRLCADSRRQREETVQALELQISQATERLNRLTDAYIDRLIERDVFEARKKALLAERQELEGQIGDWQGGKRDVGTEVADFLERADNAYLAYKLGNPEEQRDLLGCFTSNRLVDRKTPIITLALPLRVIADRPKCPIGGPCRDIPRTWQALLSRLTSLIARATVSPGMEPSA